MSENYGRVATKGKADHSYLDTNIKVAKILELDNVASKLSEKDLICIGNDVVEGYDTDLASRKPWEKDLENWTRLALQISEPKT
jgi:hypothetical protein